MPASSMTVTLVLSALALIWGLNLVLFPGRRPRPEVERRGAFGALGLGGLLQLLTLGRRLLLRH